VVEGNRSFASAISDITPGKNLANSL
jgi:hypothetical protein